MNRGFTLVELLIVIGILVVVSGVGFIELSRNKGGRDIELSVNEVVALIRDVQKRSITGENGKEWGIRFNNSEITTHTYEVFSGPDYASGEVDQTYSLKRNVIFGNPGRGLSFDVVFRALSGRLNETSIVSLTNKRREGVVGDIIMSQRGTVTTRMDNGVMGYWHFDEAVSMNVYDASGLSNTGVINGSTWQSQASCRAGSCLGFDGFDDYISITDSSALQITRELTLEAWIKRDVLDGTFRQIVRKGVNYFLLINNENEIAMGINDSHFNDGFPLSGTGSWEHVVGTYSESNNEIRIYLNGNLVRTVGTTLSLGTNNDALIIGATETGAQFFDGTIDEVKVYNRVLSAEEIKNHYNDLN